MIDIDTQFKDISAATITSDILRVVVILDQGGNIASLYDLRDDRELLW